jgi:hypothetical protein
MNRLIACASMAACLALPSITFARGHGDRDDHRHWHDRGDHDDRGYRDGGYRDGRYRDDDDRYGHHDHVPGPVRFVGEVVALPFEVGAAVIGGVATILTAPFRYHDYDDRRQEAYYGPPRYDERDDRGPYYGPPAQVYGPPVQMYGPPAGGYYYDPPPGYDNR